MAFVPEEKLTLTDEFLDPLPVEQSVVAKIIVSKLVDVACTFRYAPMLTECIEKLKTLPSAAIRYASEIRIIGIIWA